MLRRTLSAAILTAVLLSSACCHAGESDGEKVLERFVGSWRTDVTDKPSKSLPDGGKRTDNEITSWVLNRRYILGRHISRPGDVKVLWLMTSDAGTKGYPFWFFDSRGTLGGQWSGTWDEASSTLTFQATDTPKGWTSRGTNRFPDDKTNLVSVWMKDDSGELLFDGQAKKTRQGDDFGKRTLAAWSKNGKADTEQSDEMKVLERLIGDWTATAVSKPAVWTPEEIRTTSRITRTWVLDGGFVLDNSTASDGKESISLLTHDPRKEAYLAWWFGSERHRNQSTGQWDETTQTMSFRAELEGGLTSQGTLRFKDASHHDWRVVVTDNDGKLYFDTTWTVDRVTK